MKSSWESLLGRRLVGLELMRGEGKRGGIGMRRGGWSMLSVSEVCIFLPCVLNVRMEGCGG